MRLGAGEMSAAKQLYKHRDTALPAAKLLYEHRDTAVPAAKFLYEHKDTVVPAAKFLNEHQDTAVPAAKILYEPSDTSTGRRDPSYAHRGSGNLSVQEFGQIGGSLQMSGKASDNMYSSSTSNGGADDKYAIKPRVSSSYNDNTGNDYQDNRMGTYKNSSNDYAHNNYTWDDDNYVEDSPSGNRQEWNDNEQQSFNNQVTMTGKIVKCIYNFPAETEADLEIQIGDLIHITNIINADWYEGQLNNKKGQFPAAYVEECKDEECQFPESFVKECKDMCDLAVATANFTGDQEGDLSFNNGDFIVVTEIIDENWMQGYVKGGGHGIFPCTFVRLISMDDAIFTGKSNKSLVSTMETKVFSVVDNTEVNSNNNETELIASNHSVDNTVAADTNPTNEPNAANESLWVDVVESFNAMDSTELDLVVGTKVQVLHIVDDFWCEGITVDGKKGIFPRNFVNLQETKVTPPPAAVVVVSEVSKQNSTVLTPASNNIGESHKTNDETESSIDEKVTSESVIGRCIAIYNFPGTEEGDLNFDSGSEILLLEKINDNWLRGKIDGRVGIFPSNYAEVKEMYPVEETVGATRKLEVQSDTNENQVNNGSEKTVITQHYDDDDDYMNSEIYSAELLDNQVVKDEVAGKLISNKILNTYENTTLRKSPEPQKKPVKPETELLKKPLAKPQLEPPSKPAKPEPPSKPEAPSKPGKPQRPKLPDSKKPIDDCANPFVYQFQTKSQPLVIIPAKYFKPGSSNVLIVKNWEGQEYVSSDIKGNAESGDT